MNIYSLIKPLGAFFVLMGSIIMVGWIADIQLLKTFIPGSGVTNFPTALSFVLAGLVLRSFYRLTIGEKQGNSMARIMACAGLFLLLFFPLVAGYFWNIPLGLDTIFEPVIVNGIASQTILPSVGAILCMGVLFVMTVLVSVGTSISKVSRWGGIFLFGFGVLALVGYILHEPTLYFASGKSDGMTFRAAFGFALMGAAFLALSVRPHTDHQPVEGETAHAPPA